MNKEAEELTMTFEPKTIEHLGVKMYSHIPPALAELIANAYDACATKVKIKLYDDTEKKIIVEDNGTGMSFSDINDFYLRIGRNRREENQVTQCNRQATGKKGLGKLALFGIGNSITVKSIKAGEKTVFTLDYNEIQDWEGANYTPKFKQTLTDEDNGTCFILKNLNRVSDFPIDAYSISISKLFNFKAEDFKVYISLNNDEPVLIDNKLKFESIESEFVWDFPLKSKFVNHDFEKKHQILGKISTAEKPLKPGLRGITLFANGRMINSQEFFGATESSHFFSYATGWLDVDFIDEDGEDLISTDRQSINWESDLTSLMKEYLVECLKEIEKDWRTKRKEKRIENVQKNSDININDWLDKVPDNVKDHLEGLISKFGDSELNTKEQTNVLETLHTLVPEYPKYHWRHLNEQIRQVAKEDYEKSDYLRAAEEAIKLYEHQVKNKSQLLADLGTSLMGRAFGSGSELVVSD